MGLLTHARRESSIERVVHARARRERGSERARARESERARASESECVEILLVIGGEDDASD